MKKYVMIFICFLFVLSSVSCRNTNNNKTNDDSSTADITSEESAVSTYPDDNTAEAAAKTTSRETAPVDYSINTETYTDSTHSNSSVSIQYPKLSSNKRNFTKVNQFIKNTVLDTIGNTYEKDYTNLTLKLNYRISFKATPHRVTVRSKYGKIEI